MTWDELIDDLYSLYDGGPMNGNGENEVVIRLSGSDYSVTDVKFEHEQVVIVGNHP